MIRRILAVFTLIISMVSLAEFVCAKIEVPGRTQNRINDYAGVMDDRARLYLERLVSMMEQKTPEPVEVMVTTFSSLEGWDFNEFAMQYFENWRKIKINKRDNGVILLLVMDTNSFTIGVGRNLSGILSKEVIEKVTQDHILPEFRQGRYSEGLKNGAESIVKILESATIPTDAKRPWKILGFAVIVVSFILLIKRRIHP